MPRKNVGCRHTLGPRLCSFSLGSPGKRTATATCSQQPRQLLRDGILEMAAFHGSDRACYIYILLVRRFIGKNGTSEAVQYARVAGGGEGACAGIFMDRGIS